MELENLTEHTVKTLKNLNVDDFIKLIDIMQSRSMDEWDIYYWAKEKGGGDSGIK